MVGLCFILNYEISGYIYISTILLLQLYILVMQYCNDASFHFAVLLGLSLFNHNFLNWKKLKTDNCQLFAAGLFFNTPHYLSKIDCANVWNNLHVLDN